MCTIRHSITCCVAALLLISTQLVPPWRLEPDTYTLKTGKGITHKIWEFNLRLKTDASDYGPAPGKPVLTGSGMMGDRASLVFASPGEISSFIKETCN